MVDDKKVAVDVERKPFLVPPATTVMETSELVNFPRQRLATWMSVYIVSALSFIGAAQYTMYFSSLWPYLQVLDPSISETFFGYIVAIFSAGQIISAPLFGFWSNSIRQVRIPIIMGMLLMFIGNMLYLALEWVNFPGLLLLVARFIIGLGSGNVVLMRSYAATVFDDENDRTRALTFVTCGQAVGLTIGPALQLLFTPLKYPGVTVLPHFHLYSAPAVFSNLMNFLGTCSMIWLFEEKFIGIVEEVREGGEEEFRQRILPPYDCIALSICLVTRFTYMFINTNLETIGSPYSMMMFVWTESAAVFYTSLAQGAIGILTLGTYLVMIYFKLEKRISNRIGSIVGLAVMILFHIVTYSWPFLPGRVKLMSHHDAILNTTAGCNDEKFTWCEDLRPVNVWFYYSTYVLAMGLAFPILNISNTALFANILGPRRQGTQQGFLQMSGGSARLVGPVIISILYTMYGPTMAWVMEIIVISGTLVLWFTFFKRLVPLVVPSTMIVDEDFHKVSAVDVAPDPSALSSSSQIHSIHKSKSSIRQARIIEPLSANNSYINLPGGATVSKSRSNTAKSADSKRAAAKSIVEVKAGQADLIWDDIMLDVEGAGGVRDEQSRPEPSIPKQE